MRAMLTAGVLVVSLWASAQSAPSAVTGLSIAVVPVRPLLVSGQSNLAGELPALAAAFPAPVYGVWQIATPISGWAQTDTNMLWQSLYLLAHRQDYAPFSAFVWWQGESDAVPVQTADYATPARALIAAVRAGTNQPDLPVVIVRVLDYPEFATIRTAQELIVADDPYAVLVNTDPYKQAGGTNYHLSPAGYASVAQLIRLAVLSY